MDSWPKDKGSCSCYGSVHKVKRNCLVCGRICCKEEKVLYCPYCGSDMITVPENSDFSMARAKQMAEMLHSADKTNIDQSIIDEDDGHLLRVLEKKEERKWKINEYF